MKARSFLCSTVASVCLVGLLGVAEAEEEKAKPDATMEVESKSVGVGVGISWGGGKLHYKGHTHNLEVDGLTVGTVGASQIRATGEVYHLKNLADFDGNYTAVVGGATAGGGAGALIMKNQNGVEIRMVATTQGVSLTAGVSGVKLSVKK